MSNDPEDFTPLTAKAARVQKALSSVRGRATARNGEVTMEVSVDGRITNLSMTQWFSQLHPDVAAQLLAHTHSAALDDAQMAAADIRRELTDDYRVVRLIDKITSASPPPPPTPPPVHRNDDDYQQGSSIYDRW
ncbi:YbaB/EbfC family nucleoid-associated protein [Rhodococcus sp. G-MC3]|uniref:YbaB/EbfC family nucleoid-associated protein n=1 Tax=Rhodococcus sp. G-MC3 TaxID=3046209 RepID=UPI0024BB0B4C|nr:YbaB/EbfC family nucleoid-associated protein [Rhodococcus sp. G-MC3]MDJ0395658.1 YbaB/EbfC family nucleoid-associated protein [Rhodococcus sp. G-MC3]